MAHRTTALIICALGLAGCAPLRSHVAPIRNTAQGVYHFREVVAKADPPVTLDGEVAFLTDTVIVSLAKATCEYQKESGAKGSITYKCGQVKLMFDRANPKGENLYQVLTNGWGQRRVCVSRRPDPSTGGEMCVQHGDQRVEARVALYGTLTLTAQ